MVCIVLLTTTAILGYIKFYNPIIFESNEIKFDNSSQLIGETDTIERLKTLANSGTNWGNSPFGNGKPLIEDDTQKINFKKSDTDWKTRTFSGITYVYSEGNPIQVALTIDDLKKDLSEKCPEDLDDPKRIFCNEESGYMSSEVEKYLLIK